LRTLKQMACGTLVTTYGNGDGDDEVIEVNLDDVPEHVHQILFVVNIYSKGTTLSSLQNAFCRVLDDSQRTLVHYS